MNVCIDTTTCSGAYSGTGVYTASLLKSLRRINNVDHLTLMGGTSASLTEFGDRHLYKHLSSWHKLIQLHLHGNLPNIQADISFFPNYFIPAEWSIPSVVTIHDLSFITHGHYYTRRMRLFYSHMVRRSIEQAAQILTVSETTRNALYQHFPDLRAPVIVNPPGSRLGPRQLPVDTDSPYLLYAGNIEPKKNILAMMEGFRRADMQDVTLKLTGRLHAPAGFRKQFWDQIRSTPNIEYTGYIDETSLSGMMDQCIGLVNLSHVEGFGLPVREAIEKNKPVLISTDPALTELGRDEVIQTEADHPGNIAVGFQRFIKHIIQTPEVRYSRRPGWSEFRHHLESTISSVHRRYCPQLPTTKVSDNRIQQAIIEGAAYASVFKAPVAIPQLYQLLYRVSCSYQQYKAQLRKVVSSHKEIHSDGRYIWFDHSLNPTLHRHNHLTPNREFLGDHNGTIQLLSRLPGVRGLFYSGGSAHGSGLHQRDIDLFVVARSHMVWIAYTLIRLLVRLRRRQPTICTNYLVDQEALPITYQQDYFTAFQLVHLRPVPGCRSCPDIQSANGWILAYFPNYPLPAPPPKQPALRASRILKLINLALMHLWTRRWHKMNCRNLQGGMMWDAHRIKLHPYDNRPYIYRRFKEILHGMSKRFTPEKAKQTFTQP